MYENEIKRGSIYAIIPARSGRKGIKDKNIRCLKGYPLMAYSIAIAKKCQRVSRIIVSTDSSDYARIANYYGAETPFLRPAEISTDSSTDFEFMEHAIEWFHKNEHELPEYFMHLRPTSPIRRLNIVDDAIDRILADKYATSLRSAHKSTHTPYKWFCMGRDGYYRSFVKGMSTDQANNPRQDFEPVYIPDGYVDILKTEFITKNQLLHGDRVVGFVVPDNIDLDVMADMEQLEYYMDKKKEPLLEFLRKNFKKLDEVEF